MFDLPILRAASDAARCGMARSDKRSACSTSTPHPPDSLPRFPSGLTKDNPEAQREGEGKRRVELMKVRKDRAMVALDWAGQALGFLKGL